MPNDDDIVGLAGEYVLGTLGAAERAEAEARIARDSAFAAAVHDWESHLAPLAEAAPPVEPPAYLRQRILEAVGGSGLAGDNVVQLRKQLGLWRSLTVGAAALAAAL